MAIRVTSTKDYQFNGVKAMVYGPTGRGKTKLCATAPRPVIISNESGLLSLVGVDIPVIEVKSIADITEAYKYVSQSAASVNFDTICLDSISEIAEVVLGEHKATEKDPRQAYGRLADDMSAMIRLFRDIKGKNVYMTAKELKYVDEFSGKITYMPSMPGKTLLNSLSYFFDEVFAYRLGVLESGQTYRYLQTESDMNYDCKNRGVQLPPQIEPHLGKVFGILSGTPPVTN
ncbi:MAG: ATP-binding protein [Candidatus Humimicrobiaceae bacterium]